MLEFGHGISNSDRSKSITCFVVTVISVFSTQFALLMVPRYFPYSLLPLFFLSVVAMFAMACLGRFCKSLLDVRASAPVFVFINILFVWFVYIVIVRKAISPLLNVIYNMELLLLVIGLCRIVTSDPGLVTFGSSDLEKFVNSPFLDAEAHFEPPVSHQRLRFCKYCKAHVKGFDHHCPAFANCIGEKNHALFIVLLIGFIISEASYVEHTFRFAAEKSYETAEGYEWKLSLSEELVISTMLFCLLQVIWQVVFLIWHIYCICVNIKTDECINWKRYEEFQLIVQLEPMPGQLLSEIRFRGVFGFVRDGNFITQSQTKCYYSGFGLVWVRELYL